MAEHVNVLEAFALAASVEQFRSVSTLPQGQRQAVLHAEKIETKFGDKIKARLLLEAGGEATVLLPSRFSSLPDAVLNSINAAADGGTPYFLSYLGREGNAFKINLTQ